MSVFASQFTKQVTLGSADSELVVMIRKLSGSSLRAARQVRTIDDLQRTKALGAEVMRVFREMSDERDRAGIVSPTPVLTLEEQRTARYAQFDRDDVLVRGVSAWSDPIKVTPEALRDLDEDAAEKLFREIVDLALGPLEEEAAPEGKAALSSPSTESSMT